MNVRFAQVFNSKLIAAQSYELVVLNGHPECPLKGAKISQRRQSFRAELGRQLQVLSQTDPRRTASRLEAWAGRPIFLHPSTGAFMPTARNTSRAMPKPLYRTFPSIACSSRTGIQQPAETRRPAEKASPSDQGDPTAHALPVDRAGGRQHRAHVRSAFRPFIADGDDIAPPVSAVLLGAQRISSRNRNKAPSFELRLLDASEVDDRALRGQVSARPTTPPVRESARDPGKMTS